MQDAARPPRGQGPCRAPVAVVGLVALGLAGQVETDDVVGMPCEQPLVLGRADDVVRRRDDGRQVADGGRREAEGAEGSDLGHGTFRGRGSGADGLRDVRIVR